MARLLHSKKMVSRLALTGSIVFALMAFQADANEAKEAELPFDQWLENFKDDARAKGISDATLKAAFPSGLVPNEKVLGYDRRQPEFTHSFWSYLNRAISDKRINRGRELLKTHDSLLQEVYRKHGVQPRFLVAFWGLESNFGDFTGGFSVPESLATLAHDPRRSAFFTEELHHALSIIDEGSISAERMKGSWAGAMGQTQFMPSTFVRYAIDGDRDRKRDLWGSLPDIMNSSANYLSQIGWKGDETWGREVTLPEGFDLDLVGNRKGKHIREWSNLGVKNAYGNALPNADIEGYLILPAGIKGPAFLVYNNFEKILIWNRSNSYALAVGYLADRLIGKGPLVAKPPKDETPIPRIEIEAMQARLNALGFDAGTPDGMVGPMTRAAIKGFQKQNNLPADGFPSHALVQQIIAQ